jgi:radical SAM/SPASM domain protein of ACGX system
MVKFGLQWHITNACEQRCHHCYIYNEKNVKTNVLSFDKIKLGIDNYINYCKKYKFEPQIAYTGGDPLLHPDFKKIIEYSHKKGINIHILGNPHMLTLKMAKFLKKNGVTSYQMSLDGLEKTHDSLRAKGSFKKTMNAYKILKQVGIKSDCMFTLSKKNIKELIPLIKFIDGKVDVFAFARIVPFGKYPKNELIYSKDFRWLLYQVLELFFKLKDSKTRYARKDHLFTLLYQELGLFHQINFDPKLIYSGCSSGVAHFCADVDGSVLTCRRIGTVAGNFLDNSFDNIFFKSKEMQKMRDIKKYECKDCDLFNFCRGCPAIPYALGKGIYAKDPGCWK